MFTTLPSEILECIFTFVIADYIDSEPTYMRIRPYSVRPITSKSTNCLASLTRVDKRWGNVATALLYRSIVIRPKKCAALLHRTLSASIPLRSSVCAISVDIGDDDATSEHHIAVLDLCTNLQHVSLHCACGSPVYYRALATRRRLRSIWITVESESFLIKSPPFCSFPDLASMMREWHELEYVNADEGTIIEQDLELYNIEPLPKLRTVRIGGNLTESNVGALSRLAPHMESFANFDALVFPQGMHNTLSSWSQTLKSLDLCIDDSGSDRDVRGWQLASIAMSTLPRLQELFLGGRVPAFVISTAFPPTVRSLDLWIYSGHLPVLTSALERKEYAPLLRDMRVSVSFSCEVGRFKPDDVESLRVVCERRGVVLKGLGWNG